MKKGPRDWLGSFTPTVLTEIGRLEQPRQRQQQNVTKNEFALFKLHQRIFLERNSKGQCSDDEAMYQKRYYFFPIVSKIVYEACFDVFHILFAAGHVELAVVLA